MIFFLMSTFPKIYSSISPRKIHPRTSRSLDQSLLRKPQQNESKSYPPTLPTYLNLKKKEKKIFPSILTTTTNSFPFFLSPTKQLPPALFTCGTLDVLLDDSVLMATKWAMSGAESILKLYPGAPHGFTFFPVGGTEQTEIALRDIGEFMNDRLAD